MIQISKYVHAIFIAILGMWMPLTFDNLMGNLVEGLMIGLALRLARESGREETEE